ncbi:MAG: Brp/Blh family beta-carotene 15,15'-dioxygenase [Bryobacter sp.]|nr:Brp/Blh family beta-carotene 15,15'-dioxygenase [Bryobacter sp. CoA8 C33]
MRGLLHAGDTLCAALIVLLSTVWLVEPQATEWVALALILFAGIPHGAYDLHLARIRWAGISGLARIAAYVALGLAMSLVCLYFPFWGLAIFLLLSVAHFAEGKMASGRDLGAAWMGLSAVAAPLLLHGGMAAGYMKYFVKVPEDWIGNCPMAGWFVWGLAALVVGGDLARKRHSEAWQRGLCLAGWFLLPPLAGFSVWFLGRHSRQHLAECVRRFAAERQGMAASLVATSVLAILLIAPLLLRFHPRELSQLVAASVILIAGLTLPHMIVTSEMISRR